MLSMHDIRDSLLTTSDLFSLGDSKLLLWFLCLSVYLINSELLGKSSCTKVGSPHNLQTRGKLTQSQDSTKVILSLIILFYPLK